MKNAIAQYESLEKEVTNLKLQAEKKGDEKAKNEVKKVVKHIQ